MKNLKLFTLKNYILIFIFSLSATFCFSQEKEMESKSINIDVGKSTIEWVGKKVIGQHNGTISFKSGTLVKENGKLVGGSFEVDMNSIVCDDLSGEKKGNLEWHLKSDDFFGAEKFPVASLTITEITPTEEKGMYNAKGDFTIKGITKPIEFSLTKGEKSLMANVTIDRTLFDIRYGSDSFFDNLGDRAIDNDFTLTINLVK